MKGLLQQAVSGQHNPIAPLLSDRCFFYKPFQDPVFPNGFHTDKLHEDVLFVKHRSWDHGPLGGNLAMYRTPVIGNPTGQWIQRIPPLFRVLVKVEVASRCVLEKGVVFFQQP